MTAKITVIKSAANSRIITITQVRRAGGCGGEEVEQGAARVGQIGAAAGHGKHVRCQLPHHHHHPGRGQAGLRIRGRGVAGWLPSLRKYSTPMVTPHIPTLAHTYPHLIDLTSGTGSDRAVAQRMTVIFAVNLTAPHLPTSAPYFPTPHRRRWLCGKRRAGTRRSPPRPPCSPPRPAPARPSHTTTSLWTTAMQVRGAGGHEWRLIVLHGGRGCGCTPLHITTTFPCKCAGQGKTRGRITGVAKGLYSSTQHNFMLNNGYASAWGRGLPGAGFKCGTGLQFLS